MTLVKENIKCLAFKTTKKLVRSFVNQFLICTFFGSQLEMNWNWQMVGLNQENFWRLLVFQLLKFWMKNFQRKRRRTKRRKPLSSMNSFCVSTSMDSHYRFHKLRILIALLKREERARLYRCKIFSSKQNLNHHWKENSLNKMSVL